MSYLPHADRQIRVDFDLFLIPLSADIRSGKIRIAGYRLQAMAMMAKLIYGEACRFGLESGGCARCT